jgi:hypothetical protein
VDPMLVGVGTGSIRGDWTKGGPPCGMSVAEVSWLGVDELSFSFFFLFPVWRGRRARRLDVFTVGCSVLATH